MAEERLREGGREGGNEGGTSGQERERVMSHISQEERPVTQMEGLETEPVQVSSWTSRMQ